MTQDNVLVVRPAWRREWRGFILIGLLVFALLNVELFAHYIAIPISMIENSIRMRINWKPFVNLALLSILLLTVIGIVFRHYRHRYQITEEGVAHVIGILGREERPISYHRMTLATKKQSVVEFLFNLGTISLFSSGTDRADVVITGVKSPKKLLDRIQSGMRHASAQS